MQYLSDHATGVVLFLVAIFIIVVIIGKILKARSEAYINIPEDDYEDHFPEKKEALEETTVYVPPHYKDEDDYKDEDEDDAIERLEKVAKEVQEHDYTNAALLTKPSNVIDIGRASRKLTDDEVRYMRANYKLGRDDLSMIAIKYDISTSSVRRILKEETYKDVLPL